MKATTGTTAIPVRKQTQRLLTRMNSTLFHCVGMGILLETANAAQCSVDQGGMRSTSEGQGAALSRLTAFAAETWPEFDWEQASAAMVKSFRAGRLQSAMPHDLYERIQVYVPLFYSVVSRIAEDATLRQLLERSSPAGYQNDRSPLGTFRMAHFSLFRVYAVHRELAQLRDNLIRRAYELLRAYWADGSLFPEVEYADFLKRAYFRLVGNSRITRLQRLSFYALTHWGMGQSQGSSPRCTSVGAARYAAKGPALRPACALPGNVMVR